MKPANYPQDLELPRKPENPGSAGNYPQAFSVKFYFPIVTKISLGRRNR
jgi:hypothetical protein